MSVDKVGGSEGGGVAEARVQSDEPGQAAAGRGEGAVRRGPGAGLRRTSRGGFRVCLVSALLAILFIFRVFVRSLGSTLVVRVSSAVRS